MKDITRNDLWGLDFEKTTITKNNGLESESLLQFIDNRTGLVFLEETNSSIEQEKSANDTKIDPVLKTSSKNSGSLVGTKHVSSLCLRAEKLEFSGG